MANVSEHEVLLTNMGQAQREENMAGGKDSKTDRIIQDALEEEQKEKRKRKGAKGQRGWFLHCCGEHVFFIDPNSPRRLR